MHEFEIISRYFAPLGGEDTDVVLGIGDDAAVIRPPDGQQLAVAVDCIVAGIHFPEMLDPEDIGYRAVAVNLSDLAAMGATPRWATLALTMPESDAAWLERFARGLAEALDLGAVVLIGGDTTRGPLAVTVQLIGVIPPDTALTRHGAQPGDAVFVSGHPGDARAGLEILQTGQRPRADAAGLVARFRRPTPRLELGAALRGLASSAIDVSDGLLADLGHIVHASGCGAEVNWAALPVSEALVQRHAVARAREYAAAGGDDYELCFTAPPGQVDAVRSLDGRCGCAVTRIGTVTKGASVTCLDEAGRRVTPTATGYRHF